MSTRDSIKEAEKEIALVRQAKRIQEAVKYIEEQKAELQRQLNELDYIEDVNGNLIYEPWHYSEEKSEISEQFRILTNIAYLLTTDRA